MPFEPALYRLKVAHGFLDESRQDVKLGRFRSAVDNSQLAVENAAKAVLALVLPVGKTHNPAPQLRDALIKGHLARGIEEEVKRLAECAEELGFDVHIQTDYGDETDGLTPWELFDERDAHEALSLAEEAVGLAEAIVHDVRSAGFEHIG